MNFQTTMRLLCCGLVWLAVQTPASAEDFAEAIHAYLEHCVHAEIPTGCIVLGIVDEHGSRVVSCGGLDNGTDQQANGDTVFCLHSMTGTFTALLLQDMVERGDMKADDPAAKYLPKSIKLPTRNGKQITLRHLLQETSGFPNFRDTFDPESAENPLADFTIEKMDAFVSGCALVADPGTKHFHGGADKGLLAQAIEHKAGTDFESIMVNRILQPLGMDSTRFALTPQLKSRLATEHNEFGYATPMIDWGALKPLAGLYSTANDLLKLISALDLTRSTLPPQLQKIIETGFFKHGDEIFDAGGGAFGCRAYVIFDKARHRGVVVLSTSTDLKRDFGDYLLAGEWQSDRRPNETNGGTAIDDSCVGEYRAASAQFTIGVRREADRLFAAASGPESFSAHASLPPGGGELVPESKDQFFERLSDRSVTFLRDAQGNVTGLSIGDQTKTFAFQKTSDHPPTVSAPVKPRVAVKLDTPLLDACVGKYEFPQGTLKIWREEGQLLGQIRGEHVLKGAFHIYPESETKFFLKIDGAQLTFIKNEDGEVTAAIHHSSHPEVADSLGKKQNG